MTDTPTYSALTRQPDSFKNLHENRFNFVIHNLPHASYTCQSVALPGVALSSPEIGYPNVVKPHPGIRAEFTDFAIEFVVDQNLQNYLEVWNWIIGLGKPEDLKQRADFMNSNRLGSAAYRGVRPYNVFSDCTLILNTTQHNPNIEITFRDAFPVALDPVALTSKSVDAHELTVTARFRYEQYVFARKGIQP